MTPEPAPFTPVPAPEPPRTSRLGWMVAALSAVALILIAVLIAVMASGDKDADAPFFTKSDTFALSGSLTLTDPDGYLTAGDDCVGDGGYDDIAPGATVTIYDAAGKIIATGRLKNAKDTNDGCTAEFLIQDVPGGHDFYQVEVSHRGKVTYSEADARAGRINLTLG